MLIVAGEIEIDPARREEAIAAAREMMDATRREAGCVAYAFSADLADPGRFRIFEEWESQAALGLHLDSEEHRSVLTAIAPLRKQPVIHFDTVIRRAGLETVEAARGT